MDFLTTILAQLFEKFKAGNPKVAAAALFLLFLVYQFAHQGVALSLFPDAPWLSEALRWLSAFLLAVTGAQTTLFLDGKVRSDREAQYRALMGLRSPQVEDNRDKADPLTKILATLFDKFKVSSPKAAAWLLLALYLGVEAAHRGVALKLFGLPPIFDEILVFLGGLLLALTSSKTVQFLPLALRKRREAQYEANIAA